MITINLLPDDYRRRAKSPMGAIAAVAAAVFINASLIAYYCYLEFGVSSNIETTRSVLQLDLDGLTPQVSYHKKLESEISQRSAREQTLAEITSSRVLWTKTVDELVDVVHAGREGIEHFIWFEDLDVKQNSGGRQGSSHGHLKANGHSGSESFDQVSNFLEDIEDQDLSSLSTIFAKPEPPQGQINTPDEELIPAVNWSFPLTINLLSPEARTANRLADTEVPQ